MKSKKFDIKNLTKKQKITIAVATVLLATVVALSIALPIVLVGKNQPIEVSFEQFDRLSDYSVTVKWNKSAGAEKYTVEYCYGKIKEESVKKLTTEANVATITRRTGVLSVRVKADNGNFGEWKSIDIPALRLKKPTSVTISDTDFKASWAEVVFDYYGVKKPVSKYEYDIGIDKYTSVGFYEYGETRETSSFVPYIIANIDYDEEGTEPWEDVTFVFRVKAITDPKFSGSETDAESYLNNAYSDSEYAEASIIITKEIYEGLKSL